MEKTLQLSFWGQFKDAPTEASYQSAALQGTKRSLPPVLIILATVFTLFLIPDMLANHGNPMLARILGIRIFIILWLVLQIRMVRRVPSSTALTAWLTVSQVLVGISFLYVSSLYLIPDFTMQLLTFTLMSLSFFVLPCSLLHTSLSTGLLWALFLLLASIRFPEADLRQWLTAILFPILFILVAFSFRLRIEQEQRRMFLLNARLEQLSEQDPLTGAANRYRFTRVLDEYLASSQTGNQPFSVLLMDIDWFKRVNDQYGHLAGDSVLKGVCALFRHHLRARDLLVRWGGEEFAALLPDTSLEEAIRIAERVRETLANARFLQDGSCVTTISESGRIEPDRLRQSDEAVASGEPVISDVIAVTGSFGVASAVNGDTDKTIMGRADRLMYQAKALGRNRVVHQTDIDVSDMPKER